MVTMFATVIVTPGRNVVMGIVCVLVIVVLTVDEVRLRHLHAAETTSQAK